MRRVAVTGLGAVTPIGNSAPEVGGRRSRVAAASISSARTTPSEQAVRIAAEVKGFDPSTVASHKEARKLDRNVLLALAAAREAVADASLEGVHEPGRVGILFGTAIGGFLGIMEQAEVMRERGPSRVAPTFIPSVLVDAASGQLAISLGFRGPNYAPVSACATGSHAIGEAAELIKRGDADAVLAGGAEACIHPLIFAGFSAMRGLVSRGGIPAAGVTAVRRDARRLRDRRGRLCAGARRARRRARARCDHYAEILSYGASNDAHHMAQPDPDSLGVKEMMHRALERAEIAPEQVGYINAHGTSTPLGDAAETKAIKEVFGDHAYSLAVSSTKSVTGHCFGAAGAIEAMMCVLAVHHGVLPPTMNYEHPDPACDLDYVPNVAREVQVDVALSNAMGLGGHNGCVLVGRVD